MKIVSTLAVAAVLVVAVGCQTGTPQWPWQKKEPPLAQYDAEGNPIAGSNSSTTSLQGSPDQRFVDVPVPDGTVLDDERTFVWENPKLNLQVGHMVYTTRADAGEVAQFYINECKAIGWTLVSATQAEGAQLLFTKPGRKLVVTVSPSTERIKNLGRGRRLTLDYTPEPVE